MGQIIASKSEEDLAEKIVNMHNGQGLGFRKISKQLANEGFKMGKDSCNRLYHKYKTADTPNEKKDKELEHLRATESRAILSLKHRKEKEEIRKRLTLVVVEQRTMTFSKRKELFTDSNKLLHFCRRIMPVLDPLLWDLFTKLRGKGLQPFSRNQRCGRIASVERGKCNATSSVAEN